MREIALHSAAGSESTKFPQSVSGPENPPVRKMVLSGAVLSPADTIRYRHYAGAHLLLE